MDSNFQLNIAKKLWKRTKKDILFLKKSLKCFSTQNAEIKADIAKLQSDIEKLQNAKVADDDTDDTTTDTDAE